jgi:hypothetical protein
MARGARPAHPLLPPLLLAGLALAGCGDGADSAQDIETVSEGEARALEEAASMLDETRLPEGAVPEVDAPEAGAPEADAPGQPAETQPAR